MTQFDVVQKAAHYNQHPSGIEVIHVIRGLDFDLGSVFKYVARREGKEHVRSLKSARYYVFDHLHNQHALPEIKAPLAIQAMVSRFAATDPNPLAVAFYRRFMDLLNDLASPLLHCELVAAIDDLIREVEPTWGEASE